MANSYWFLFCFLEFRCKDKDLFCTNKIKTELFLLICKKLLEYGDSVMSALFFCVARKFLPLRHAVIFPMPRVWRGVKEILMLRQSA